MNTELNEPRLTKDEFEKACRSLNRNKASGSDRLDANFITTLFEFMKMPLFKNFDESLTPDIFPENKKIAKVAPILKSGRKDLYKL